MGLKGGISIDADSGPPGYVLWCCGGICHQLLTFFQIGCGHTVIKEVLGSRFFRNSNKWLFQSEFCSKKHPASCNVPSEKNSTFYKPLVYTRCTSYFSSMQKSNEKRNKKKSHPFSHWLFWFVVDRFYFNICIVASRNEITILQSNGIKIK